MLLPLKMRGYTRLYGHRVDERTTNELIKYYNSLGYTKEQSFLLGCFTFNNDDLIEAINEYKESYLNKKSYSFSESFRDFIEFMEFDGGDNPIIDAYIYKLSLGKDGENISKEEIIEKFRDRDGYDWFGYNDRGFNRIHIHKITKQKFDPEGYDIDGFDIDGFNKNGYDRFGYDRQGRNKEGFNSKGIHKLTGTKYDPDGYDQYGYDKFGYNREGKDRYGHDRDYYNNKDRLSTFDDEDYGAVCCSKRAPDFGFRKMFGGFDKSGYERKNCCMEGFDISEEIRTDKYEAIEENGFQNVMSNPTSTFRTNCNTVSLDNIRQNIYEGYNIETSMVRAEELFNYFNYSLNTPEENNMFGITVKLADKPNSKNKLALVGIKGKDVAPSRQNIVLLLDISGSMSGRELPMQLTLMTIISQLRDGDKLSLITYSSDDSTVIDDITFDSTKIDEIIESILSIRISGCTYGSKGLESAYKLIKKNKIEDGINRVIIMTDGDFNFGDCSTDSIKKLILKNKETGAYLSVIGTGTGNTNDELMETLAKNGNGNYCIVNNLEDVKENILNKYNSLMFTIATDVKAQIEFNPKFVKSYRLIGYENRTLNHDDFKDDSVIAEPYGCGNYAIALYELELQDLTYPTNGLKYQRAEILDSDELCTVSVRYKELGEKKSKEEQQAIIYKNAYNNEDIDMKLAYILFVLAESLRDSKFHDEHEIYKAMDLLHELITNEEYKINDAKLTILEYLLKYVVKKEVNK